MCLKARRNLIGYALPLKAAPRKSYTSCVVDESNDGPGVQGTLASLTSCNSAFSHTRTVKVGKEGSQSCKIHLGLHHDFGWQYIVD